MLSHFTAAVLYMYVDDNKGIKVNEVERFDVPTRKKAVPTISSLTSKTITQ